MRRTQGFSISVTSSSAISTTNTFYDLVQGVRQLDIQKQRLEQSTAALDLAKRKFEIGLIAEVQATMTEPYEVIAYTE